MHLVQHLIILFHIRLKRFLVKATTSSPSAAAACRHRQALHELHGRLRSSMQFCVETFECVGALPGLGLINTFELDHYDVLGRGSVPSHRLIKVHYQAAGGRSSCIRQGLDGVSKSLRISDLRNRDQNVGGRPHFPAWPQTDSAAVEGRIHSFHGYGRREPSLEGRKQRRSKRGLWPLLAMMRSRLLPNASFATGQVYGSAGGSGQP